MAQSLTIKEQMNEQKKERAGFSPCCYLSRFGRWFLKFWKFQAGKNTLPYILFKEKKNMQLYEAWKIWMEINGDITA